MTKRSDACRRRLALQIAMQLPDNEREALEVLREAQELVEYINRGRMPGPRLAVVNGEGKRAD